MVETRASRMADIRREEMERLDVRRMADNQDKALGRGRYANTGGRLINSGSLVDGLIIGAVMGLLWLLWKAVQYTCLGAFYAVRWCFRRIGRPKTEI
jgi:hypothetical protein